jgi:hypothetical protein
MELSFDIGKLWAGLVERQMRNPTEQGLLFLI